jgi:hypothetical protein
LEEYLAQHILRQGLISHDSDEEPVQTRSVPNEKCPHGKLIAARDPFD